MASPTQRLLATPKQALRWSGFSPRSNHAGHLVGVAELVDAQGITLPGYTLQIEIKAPVVTARCLFLFSIMRLHRRQRLRAYQLEVAPRTKRTHNGLQPLYGPHEHLDDEPPTTVADSGVDCENWPGALRWFFHRTAITPFPIEDPNRHVHL